jgi:hypothetical protein
MRNKNIFGMSHGLNGCGIKIAKDVLLNDLNEFAENGFIGLEDLRGFSSELYYLGGRKVSKKRKDELEKIASLKTLDNIYAMTESASRVASSAYDDFKEYEKEAFEIANGYNLNKSEVKKKFRELAKNYIKNICGFADFVTKESNDFIQSRNRFNKYKNNALQIAERYDLDKREILRNLKGGVKI